MACSFQNRVVTVIAKKTFKAIEEYHVNKLIVAGGVAANSGLREKLSELAHENNVNLSIPRINYCTDNAAMVGVAASYNYEAGKYYNIKDKMDLNAVANLKIDM